MAWPNTPGFGTTHLDAGTDSPAAARNDILALAQDVSSMIAARGAASGVASLDAGTKVPIAQLPQGANGVAVLNASGVLPTSVVPRSGVVPQVWVQTVPGSHSFIVPANVGWVYVEAWGGGGGGAWANGYEHGGGGGASGGAIKYWPVLPGDELVVVVGSPGAGASSAGGDANGTDGVDTTVTLVRTSDSLVAQRGFGGKAVSSKAGGDGGYASGYFDVRFLGGVGQTGIQTGRANFGMGGLGGCNARSGPNVYEGLNTGFGGGGYGSGLGGPPARSGASGGVIIVY